MSKEVDIKKELQKKRKGKEIEKKKSIKEVQQKKVKLIREEEELKANKSEYDNIEALRKNFLKDILGAKKKNVLIQESKEELAARCKERFEKTLEKFEIKYNDEDESTNLFVILLKLLSKKIYFPDTIKGVLSNIRDLESGAIVKTKKGSITNFYDTSTILELIKIFKTTPEIRDLYNKKKILLEDDEEIPIVEKYGSLDEAERNEKELLEKIYQDSIRLNNLWRDKIKQELTDEKTYRRIQMSDEDIKEELENEKERYELLVRMSKDFNKIKGQPGQNVKDILELLDEAMNFELKSNPNNELFIELLRIMILNDDFPEMIKNVLKNYEENQNTILSLLEELRKSKIFISRYESVRKAIKDDFNTLKSKYGSIEELISNKNREFLSLQDGIRLEEVTNPKQEEQFFKDETDRIKQLIERTKRIKANIPDELKDKTFYPLREEKSQKRSLEEDDDIEDSTFYFDQNLVLSKLPLKKKDQLLKDSLVFIKKYFDPESSVELVTNLYQQNKDKTLLEFIKRLGRLIILVDDKYLKHIAKLLNKRLEDQYYDVSEIVNLSYKELLQDIYSNPSNPNFQNLEEIIRKNIGRFTNIFLSCLRFNYTRGGYNDFSDCINKKSQEEETDVINILNLEGIDQCNIGYQNKQVFEKYRKAKEAYDSSDKNDVSESLTALSDLQKELDDIRPFLKNIIYYKEDGELYCFDYTDLVERFLRKNFNNPYTNKKFSDKFIEDFNIILSKKNIKIIKQKLKEQEEYSKLKKIEEIVRDPTKKESVQTDFSQSIFSKINLLELSLIKKLPKQTTCEYYNKYIFNKDSSLEKIIKKNQEDIDKMKEYCDIKDRREDIVMLKSEEEILEPSPSKSSSNMVSFPSLSDDKDVKKKASLPLLSSKSSSVIDDNEEANEEVDDDDDDDDDEDDEDDDSSISDESELLRPVSPESPISVIANETEDERKKREKREKIEKLSKQLTENL